MVSIQEKFSLNVAIFDIVIVAYIEKGVAYQIKSHVKRKKVAHIE